MPAGDYQIVLSRKAHKQVAEVKAAGLDGRVRRLFDVLRTDPLGEPPPYEALRGDLKGCYSRRINLHHRLVYEIFPDRKTVRILSMFTHYAALHSD